MEVKCIVAIVERGKADAIVEKAKKAGADGATILYGRGTGQSEALRFFNLHELGTGIIFTFPVSELEGLLHRNKVKS